jgi:hypothetical protein
VSTGSLRARLRIQPCRAKITSRRAAVRLSRALLRPRYVVETPKRKLDRVLDKQRHTGARYEAQIAAEQRREASSGSRPNPPPPDAILDFLDRRR